MDYIVWRARRAIDTGMREHLPVHRDFDMTVWPPHEPPPMPPEPWEINYHMGTITIPGGRYDLQDLIHKMRQVGHVFGLVTAIRVAWSRQWNSKNSKTS